MPADLGLCIDCRRVFTKHTERGTYLRCYRCHKAFQETTPPIYGPCPICGETYNTRYPTCMDCKDKVVQTTLRSER